MTALENKIAQGSSEWLSTTPASDLIRASDPIGLSPATAARNGSGRRTFSVLTLPPSRSYGFPETCWLYLPESCRYPLTDTGARTTSCRANGRFSRSHLNAEWNALCQGHHNSCWWESRLPRMKYSPRCTAIREPFHHSTRRRDHSAAAITTARWCCRARG